MRTHPNSNYLSLIFIHDNIGFSRREAILEKVIKNIKMLSLIIIAIIKLPVSLSQGNLYYKR